MPVLLAKDLVASAADANEAFAGIFASHFEHVHRYVQRRVGIEVADELASETFVQAFQSRMRYQEPRGSIEGWLLGIATNLIRRHRRTEQRRLRAYARRPPPGYAEDATAAADERVMAAAARAALFRGLSSMRAVDRDVLLLFAWEDLTYAEIAAALDIPIGTVRSRLARARTRLRTELVRWGYLADSV